MLGQYRASGGLARASEVVTSLERVLGLDVDLLARWRDERRVVCFVWQALLWLPRFQFAATDRLPMPAVHLVLAELSLVFDECERAQWFCTRHAALGGRTPIDVIGDIPAVVLAARAERCIADGSGPLTVLLPSPRVAL